MDRAESTNTVTQRVCTTDECLKSLLFSQRRGRVGRPDHGGICTYLPALFRHSFCHHRLRPHLFLRKFAAERVAGSSPVCHGRTRSSRHQREPPLRNQRPRDWRAQGDQRQLWDGKPRATNASVTGSSPIASIRFRSQYRHLQRTLGPGCLRRDSPTTGYSTSLSGFTYTTNGAAVTTNSVRPWPVPATPTITWRSRPTTPSAPSRRLSILGAPMAGGACRADITVRVSAIVKNEPATLNFVHTNMYSDEPNETTTDHSNEAVFSIHRPEARPAPMQEPGIRRICLHPAALPHHDVRHLRLQLHDYAHAGHGHGGARRRQHRHAPAGQHRHSGRA